MIPSIEGAREIQIYYLATALIYAGLAKGLKALMFSGFLGIILTPFMYVYAFGSIAITLLVFWAFLGTCLDENRKTSKI